MQRASRAARPQAAESVEADQAAAIAACKLADRLDAKAIITPVSNHAMASVIACFRPTAPILALSASEAFCSSLTMVRGVAPLHPQRPDDRQAHITRALNWLLDLALARPGDCAVVIAHSDDAIEAPDTLHVVTLHM